MNYEIKASVDRIDDEAMSLMMISTITENPELMASTLTRLLEKFVYDCDKDCYVEDEESVRKWLSVHIFMLGLKVAAKDIQRDIDVEKLLRDIEED